MDAFPTHERRRIERFVGVLGRQAGTTDLRIWSRDGSSTAYLVQVLGIVRQTYRIIGQNHAWALWYNVVALPAAAAGLIASWGHSLSDGDVARDHREF